ncbi:dihydrofolate reductase family protein [Nocardioides insulae]|uniref:dihydrofolate reductase family protein n=1 Tax=Nocardioides insulae TaxID=394734 RepID=UPI000427B8D3|nr:dihydrofolate reductase family protein [Nocardioides insulae]
MRTLLGDGRWDWPDRPWLRVNMVSTVDGSAQGEDGRSGSINNDVDREVFQSLREAAEVVLVGAGTARAEEYGEARTPMVVVSHGDLLPDSLREAANVTVRRGGGPADLRRLVEELYAAGHRRLLCEGGPTLLSGLLGAGVVDELCTTIVPRLVGGEHHRIVNGPPLDVPLELASLVEQEGTLLARWLVPEGACRIAPS